jgi:predicted  nucleic acid-binding Zn-ribbon protein
MEKTKVDDMLIEMITPKTTEIEERFSNGEGLSQSEINTLLLKSQYHHISRLNQKLDKVATDVKSLKTSFTSLEQNIKQKFDTFEQKFGTVEEKFETFEQKIDATVQKTLNKNMYFLVGVGSLTLLLSKLIDKL